MPFKVKDEDFFCLDCGVDTIAINEYYMVDPHVWTQSNAGRGLLCIGCLEQRIGFTLPLQDFTNAPVNLSHNFERSRRLRQRLGEFKGA